MWKGGRYYAIVSTPGRYHLDGKPILMTGPGTICLFSLVDEKEDIF